ncbi:hypothetical protein [Variovorax sp. V15]|uniref:hypothetical protein n=1 Tax=Variovorax sp. V15 TaxID=3065952 RepID=UPI0034E8B391
MANDKKSNPSFISPRGVFVYPALNKPDFGTKDYPKPDGEYKVTLRVPESVAEAWRNGPLKAIIEQAREEADAAWAKLPVATRKKLKEMTWNEVGTDEYDKETEEPTGFVLFKFAMKASGIRKKDNSPWSQKPTIFDSKGVTLAKPPQIWGGSEGKVSVEASAYFIPGTGAAGVSLRLKAVQLLKLVSGGQKDAAGYGFAAEEDGFDSSEYSAPEGEDAPADGAAAPADGGQEEF